MKCHGGRKVNLLKLKIQEKIPNFSMKGGLFFSDCKLVKMMKLAALL